MAPNMGVIQNGKIGFVSPLLLSSGRGDGNRRQTYFRTNRRSIAQAGRKFPSSAHRVLMTSQREQTTTAPEIPSIETLLERINPADYVNGPLVISPTAERESLRLFGLSEFDIRVVLYRDHASWCPYCHKVQLFLEAKKIPYVVKKENMNCYGSKSAEFLKRNPNGLLPVILLDGELVKESTQIMFLLEETFQTPHPKLIPTEDNDKMQAFHRYMRLERLVIGAWLAALRSPAVVFSPVTKPSLESALNFVEEALGEFSGPFFFGTEPSFVDIFYSSVLERLSATCKYFRNWDVTEGREALTAWFQAMKEWEPARNIASDEYSYALSIPPQIGKVNFMSQRTAVSLNIDAQRSKYVLNDGPERQYARDEAAESLCINFSAVVEDARKGSSMDEKLTSLLSLACRSIASALINPDALEEIETTVELNIRGENIDPIVAAVKFIRQRCCSPRDMTVDGLEQFCGAINWFIRSVGKEP